MPDLRQTLKLLQGLQELDRDLFKLQAQIKRFPEEVTRKRDKLAAEAAKLAEVEKKYTDARVRLKEIEDLTQGHRQRVRKLEHEAGEARADAALHVAFQHEIRTLKRDIGEAEEEALALMEQIEKLKADKETLSAVQAGLDKEFAQYAANIDSEAKGTMDKAAALESERKKRLSADLPPDIQSHYEKLLQSREGQALAELDNRVCTGCHVSVPNNIYVRLARATELVFCPSCGRILYLREM